MAILGPEYAEERKEAINLMRRYLDASEAADRYGGNSAAFHAADELYDLLGGLFGIQEEEIDQ